MALLTETRTRRLSRLCVLTMMLAGAGCVLLSRLSGAPERPAFSHRVHAAQDLECSDCHPGATTSDEPGMPQLSQCLLCHNEIDAKLPPERRSSALFEGGKLKSAPLTRLSNEVVFSHKSHTASNANCGACHRGIEKSEAINSDVVVAMPNCVECHSERKVATDCATCHREIRQDRKPESHDHVWKQMHGLVARADTGKIADNCAMCHSESTCVSCHMDTPPDNHNNFWRLHGHAVAATVDRQNCAVCHRPDSCEKCHSEALPLSHNALWGAPRDTHCLTCHFPLSSGEGCAVCHKSTPSHSLAVPKPANHTAGMNCRQCHGLGAPLPHVDNGSNCNMCHL